MAITIHNGSIVVRDGQVGTQQACCCGGCCCIDGSPDPTKTTQSGCEAAGGTWHADGPCKTYDCRCCDPFRVICHERVWSTYTVVLEALSPITNPCQPDGVNDTSEGLIAIDWGQIWCGGQSDGQYCTTEWGSRCNVNDDIDIGSTGTFTQYYERWRAVDDCSECQDTGGAFCTPGITLLGCYSWNDVLLSQSFRDFFCSCGTANLCANPLP